MMKQAKPRRRHGILADDRGALASEYLLILALIVFPIGALLPLFLNMISIYSLRILQIIRVPF